MKIGYWIGRYMEAATNWRKAFSVTAAKYISIAEQMAEAGHEVEHWEFGQPIPKGCDCVFVPCWTLLASLPLDQVGKLPVVGYMDGVYLPIMEAPTMKRIDLLFTTTQHRAEEYYSLIPGKQILSVGYGTRTDFDLGQPSPYAAGTKNVIYVGRWSQAGHGLMMGLANAHPDVNFWLAGFATQQGRGMVGIQGQNIKDIRQAPNVHLIGERLKEQAAVEERFGVGAVGPVTYTGAPAFFEHADAALGTGQRKPPRGLPDHYSLACKVHFYWMHGTPSLVEHYGSQSLLTYPWNGVVYDGSNAGAVDGLQTMLQMEYTRKRIREWAVKFLSWKTVVARMLDAMEAYL